MNSNYFNFQSINVENMNGIDELEGRRVYCSGRDLHAISHEVFTYPDVVYLELSPTREASLDFQLSELPKAIGRLTDLKFLVLDTNQLRSLPNEIRDLQQLLVLVVSNNMLTSLPDAIGRLQQLESIHSANNRISELPKSLFQMRNLTFLDFSSNCLRELSNDIGQLTGLQSLLLCDNRLQKIPESIGFLRNLKTLWLGYNRLRSIPPSIINAKQLDWSGNYLSSILDGNPLEHPPLPVCREGFAAIRDFFQNDGPVAKLNFDEIQQDHDGLSSMEDDFTSRLSEQRSPYPE